MDDQKPTTKPNFNPNFKKTWKVGKLLGENQVTRYGVALPSLGHAQYAQLLKNETELAEHANYTSGRHWASTHIYAGENVASADKMPWQALNDPMRFWANSFNDADPARFNLRRLNPKRNQGHNTSASLFRQLVRTAVGGSTAVDVPLLSSGFRLRPDAATLSLMLDAWRKYHALKAKFAGLSLGETYSADKAMVLVGTMETLLLGLCSNKEHTVDITRSKDPNKSYDLWNLIRVTDMYSVYAAMLASYYYDGWSYSRGCIYDDCQHVVRYDKMDILQHQVYDTSRLSPDHISQLCRMAPGELSVDDVLHYQNTLPSNQPHEFQVEQLRFVLRNPFISEVMQSAMRSFEAIYEHVTNISGLTENERRQDFQMRRRATILRDHAPFIGEIVVLDTDGSEITIKKYDTDPEAIEEALADISAGSPELIDRIVSEISKFQQRASISIFAVPQHDCPACGRPQSIENDNPEFDGLMPIDTVRLFFALLGQLAELQKSSSSKATLG
jgi:hypothetical protein